MRTVMPVQSEHHEFETWVHARAATLHRFALLVSGSPTEAQDLVQDALSGAWPRWAELAERGTAEAYVRRSIVNGNVSRWRKHGRTTLTDEVEPYVDVRADTSDTDHGIADAMAAWELCRELPTTQRAAVVLRFHEDLDYAEIAQLLGCAEATARSHVHRALRTLRTRLEETDDE